MSKLSVQLLTFFSLLTLVLTFIPSVFASRSLVIESYKQTFTNDEDGEVKLNISDFNDGESIFFKGAFSADASTNYFGFTKKGDAWVKNSITAADQFSAKIGEWDGKLWVKPDLYDTGFKGSGNYNFKVGFYYYTSGGNLSSVNWSDTKSVNIDFVPTLTPSPTVTSTPIPTNVPIVVPTSSPTHTPIPSATLKPQNTPTTYVLVTSVKMPAGVKSTVTPVPTQDDKGTVLGESFQPSETPIEKEQKIATASKTSSLPIFILLLGGGLVFIAAAVVVSIRQIKKTH